jgi:hypothetical protein
VSRLEVVRVDAFRERAIDRRKQLVRGGSLAAFG